MNDIINNECKVTGNTEPPKLPVVSNDIMIGIYGLKNKMNGKWYVGQSFDIRDRWHCAYELMHCKSQRKIHRALSKYGYNGFEKIVLEECPPDQIILNLREDYWMNYYNSIKNGYNIRRSGSRGHHSDETRRRISIAAMGKPKSIEARQNMSKARTGTHLSEAHRKAISNALIGHRTVITQSHKDAIAKTKSLTKQKRLARLKASLIQLLVFQRSTYAVTGATSAVTGASITAGVASTTGAVSAATSATGVAEVTAAPTLVRR